MCGAAPACVALACAAAEMVLQRKEVSPLLINAITAKAGCYLSDAAVPDRFKKYIFSFSRASINSTI